MAGGDEHQPAVFRYHPDPVATGSIREAAEKCACCERDTGWIYTATFYTAREVNGHFCPWCIADGSAAERFEGEFADSVGLDGVGEDVLHEVTRRTPGFHAWQDPHWLVHCKTAAAFVGGVGYAELAARPDALAQLRADMGLDGWREEAQLEQFLTHLGESATAVLFRCTRSALPTDAGGQVAKEATEVAGSFCCRWEVLSITAEHCQMRLARCLA